MVGALVSTMVTVVLQLDLLLPRHCAGSDDVLASG